jgi:hypothetical protein
MENNSPKEEQLGEENSGKTTTENNPQPKQTLLILVLAAISLALWQMADHFTGFLSNFLHWVSVCTGLADGTYAIPESVVRKRKAIWVSYGILCLFVGLAYFRPEPDSPKPHLTVSLKLGDSDDTVVFFTNDFLLTQGYQTNANRPDGRFTFYGYPDACLVIPVQPGETSKVFNFVAENDSLVKITDLEVMVGFPNTWTCSPAEKWGKVKVSLIAFPVGKVAITNLQFWGVQTPKFLLPGDSIDFPPITNTSIKAYTREGDTGGLVAVSVRCADFSQIFIANIIYAPTSMGISNPFLARAVYDTNKQLHILAP